MARRNVTLNAAGMRALLRSEGVRSELASRGEAVLARARATAPVASGAYRESLHAFAGTTDRAVHRVAADAPHALVVQANTGHLARALDAAGGS